MKETEQEGEETMVCVNESCFVYCRIGCTKFYPDFKHCPYCGARLVSESYAMLLLKKLKED